MFHCQCAAVWTPSSALTNSVQSVESFWPRAFRCFGVVNEAAGEINVEIDDEGVSTVEPPMLRKSTCSRSNSACIGMEKAMLAIESARATTCHSPAARLYRAARC